jgi:hypothetical protein
MDFKISVNYYDIFNKLNTDLEKYIKCLKNCDNNAINDLKTHIYNEFFCF